MAAAATFAPAGGCCGTLTASISIWNRWPQSAPIGVQPLPHLGAAAIELHRPVTIDMTSTSLIEKLRIGKKYRIHQNGNAALD